MSARLAAEGSPIGAESKRASTGVAPPFRKSNGASARAGQRHLLAAPDARAGDGDRLAHARPVDRRGSPNRAARRRRTAVLVDDGAALEDELAERNVAGEGELQRRGAGIELPVARRRPASRTSRTSGRTIVKEPISTRPMISGSRRTVPVSRSIDRISASSMPVGPPTRTSFKVTVRRGKKSISGSPRSDTSRPVQAAICSPMRAFSASRGTSITAARRAQRRRAHGRENPERCASFRRGHPLVPARDRGSPRPRQAAGLALPARLWQCFNPRPASGKQGRRWTTDRSGRPTGIARRRCRSPPSRRKPADERRSRICPTTTRCTPGRSPIPAPSGISSGISAASSATRARGRSSRHYNARSTRFFPDARLNFAENLLRRAGPGDGDRLPRRGQGRAPR